MTTVTALPAFADNYIWMIARAGYAAVVDPGDAKPVIRALQETGLSLAAILVTHHHLDHTGGVAELVKTHPVPVFGPRAEAHAIRTLTHLLDDEDPVEIPELALKMRALSTPGHTLGQVAYFSPRTAQTRPWLFCGDTLFSAGCGRLFEGTAEQMHRSLERLSSLDADTEVYCGHEYTLANLAFASAVEPQNGDIGSYRERAQERRNRGLPSLPSDLSLERRINPFLRVSEPAIIAAATSRLGHRPPDAVSVFAALRSWKDRFKAP
jgi:hydroxyacylglutathione hydrolase